jgi:V8-like Glu-specific endopeptidase
VVLSLGSTACRNDAGSELNLFGGKEDLTTSPATVILAIKKDDGTMGCTGTFLRDDLLLTAAHCVSGKIQEVSFATTVDDLFGGKATAALESRPHPSFDLNGDPRKNARYDVAVVRFPKGTSKGPFPSLGTTSPKVGDTVTVIGYGYSQFDPNDPANQSGEGKRMLGTASIDKIYDNLDNTIEWKTTDADSNRAVVMAMDSGGPVFNAQGELVGVNCCASVKKAQAGGWVADSVVSNITTGPSTEFISSQLSGSSPGPGGTPAPSTKPGGPSVGGFTCEQQKAWGKCKEAWMHPVCDSVCNGG